MWTWDSQHSFRAGRKSSWGKHITSLVLRLHEHLQFADKFVVFRVVNLNAANTLHTNFSICMQSHKMPHSCLQQAQGQQTGNRQVMSPDCANVHTFQSTKSHRIAFPFFVEHFVILFHGGIVYIKCLQSSALHCQKNLSDEPYIIYDF